jgi:integrase
MFAFLEKRGVLPKSPAHPIERCEAPAKHVQGPYTDAQIHKIMAAIEKSVPFNLPMAKRTTYAPRIRAFLNLLLGTGCDVTDALLHQPSRIDAIKVGGKKEYVYRYERLKTGVGAVIPISAELAAELKNVPLEPGTTEELPFRTEGLKLKLNQKVWSNRIGAVLDAAGVEWVELPRDKQGKVERKAANAKQFRHTFAVRQLKEGQRPEDVATMLGHVDTEMIKNHYAPWVEALDLAHISRVVSARKGLKTT